MKGKILIILTVVLIQSCTNNKYLFELLKSNDTGIDFNNVINETDEFNILSEEYIFNGGGIAVSDFNNDGYPDLFFTGNMVSNELYLNQGGLRFKKVTNQSKLNSEGFWSTGVSAVDINSDGLMDLYIAGAMNPDNRENRLYVNKGINSNGIPVFEELANSYGINDKGNSMGAAFVDFDNDGDLDLYVLNN